MKKRPLLILLVAALAMLASACGYETVQSNQAGLKIYDGKVVGKVTGRTTTASPFHEVSVVKYDVGAFDNTFTNVAGEGDRKGNDSIIVNTSDKAQPSANVNVTAQFDPTQIECLYKAGIKNSKDFRDKVLRGETRSAIQLYAALVTAPEFATSRKGEVANAAMTYVQRRFGQEIPKDKTPQSEDEDDTSYAIRSLKPANQLPRKLACGTEIIRLQITDVTLPAQQQEQLNAIIAAEAARQTAVANQATKEAEAKGKVIDAQASADALTISSQSEADANRRLAESLSPQLLQLKEALACADALAKTQAKVASCGGQGGGGGTNNTVVIPAG